MKFKNDAVVYAFDADFMLQLSFVKQIRELLFLNFSPLSDVRILGIPNCIKIFIKNKSLLASL